MATKLKKHKKDEDDAGVTEAREERAPEDRKNTEVLRETTVRVDRARGGVSFWSILSGTLVAFGAFVVLTAIVGSILAASGVAEGGIQAEEITNAGMGAAIGLVIVQLLAYLWGGYSAGRMARGSGVLNGVLVAVVALILMAILGGMVAMIGTQAGVETPNLQTFPLSPSELQDLATGTGIGLLIAMLLGGGLGGYLGSRWHTKLENQSLASRTG